jgi:hypothetical protein
MQSNSITQKFEVQTIQDKIGFYMYGSNVYLIRYTFAYEEI